MNAPLVFTSHVFGEPAAQRIRILYGGSMKPANAAELLAQKDRLAAYQVQAQFALGDIYDRAASQPAPVAPVVTPPAGGAP